MRDASNVIAIQENNKAPSGGAVSSANYTLSVCCAARAAGTWTTEVRCSNNNALRASDTFTVVASALPEFPTAAAAIITSALALGSYLLLRRTITAQTRPT